MRSVPNNRIILDMESFQKSTRTSTTWVFCSKKTTTRVIKTKIMMFLGFIFFPPYWDIRKVLYTILTLCLVDEMYKTVWIFECQIQNLKQVRYGSVVFHLWHWVLSFEFVLSFDIRISDLMLFQYRWKTVLSQTAIFYHTMYEMGHWLSYLIMGRSFYRLFDEYYCARL